jgi:hypothetical protein
MCLNRGGDYLLTKVKDLIRSFGIVVSVVIELRIDRFRHMILDVVNREHYKFIGLIYIIISNRGAIASMHGAPSGIGHLHLSFNERILIILCEIVKMTESAILILLSHSLEAGLNNKEILSHISLSIHELLGDCHV